MFSKRKFLLTGVLLLVVSSLSLAIPLRVAHAAPVDTSHPGGCLNSPDNLVRACISINQYEDIKPDVYFDPSIQSGQLYPNCMIWIELKDSYGQSNPGDGYPFTYFPCFDEQPQPLDCLSSVATHQCGPGYGIYYSPNLYIGDFWSTTAWLTYGNSPCVPFGPPPGLPGNDNDPLAGSGATGDCAISSKAVSPPLST